MVGETKAVLETMHRLVRAVIECKASDSDGATCRVALELERSMAAKAWEGRSIQLTQVPQFGPVLMRKFVAAGITTIYALAEAGTGDIERIASRNPPFGKKVIDELEMFPRLTLETRVTGRKPRNPSETPVARIDAVIGFSNTKGKPKWHGKIPSVTFMAETTGGELAYWWRGSLRKFKEEDGNKLPLQFEVELSDCQEEIVCHLSCDEIVGTIVSSTLHHDLPASAFPPKPCRQTLAESRKPDVKTSATASWLDDEIDDGDLLEMVHEGNDDLQEQDYSDALDDEDLWPVIDRDGNIHRKEEAAQKVATTKQKQRRPSHSDTTEEIPWQPIKLPNGKYKCNHHCADAGVKRNGRACTHKCCRDGVDNPRKPKRTVSKRKAEDDEAIADMAPSKYSKTKAPEKRVKGGELPRNEIKTPQYTPVQDLATYTPKQSDFLVDLDGFDLDDEGLIDLTKVDSASDGSSMNWKESVSGRSHFNAQSTRNTRLPAKNSSNIFEGISDDNLQDRFTPTRAGGGRKKGQAVDMHPGLRKGQSASTDDFSGGSVIECLATEENGDPAELYRVDRAAASSSSGVRYPNDLNVKSQLDRKKATPATPASSNSAPAYRRDKGVLGFPVTAVSASNHNPLEQKDGVKWGETEEEALVSMSDVFSADFVDLSTWSSIDQGNADFSHSPLVEQTPKDTDTLILQTPQSDGAVVKGPPLINNGSAEPKQKNLEWMTEADREFLDQYLDLVEIID